jgi:hypothetical protein
MSFSCDFSAQGHVSAESFPSEVKGMFLTLAIILAVIWVILWLAVHITSGLIHILIALAVISFIVHLVRGRPAHA